MGGKAPKIKKTDPSTYEADIQTRRQAMEFDVTQRANKTQAQALAYKDQAVSNMNEGLGLLSSFLDQRIESQKRINKVYGDANTVDVERLRNEAKMGAKQLSSGFLSSLRGG